MDNKGMLMMMDCTLYGNTATSDGGGLATSGTAQVVNCTITDNNVTIGSSGVFGGGIFGQTVVPQLFNTIVAGNFQGAAGSTIANDLAGIADPTSAFDLIGTSEAAGLVNGTNNNQVGVSNPGLAPLASNGGPTQTVQLLPGSPAIDYGSNAYVPVTSTDQRGFVRIVNGTVDLGACEVQSVSTAPANQTASHGVATAINLVRSPR